MHVENYVHVFVAFRALFEQELERDQASELVDVLDGSVVSPGGFVGEELVHFDERFEVVFVLEESWGDDFGFGFFDVDAHSDDDVDEDLDGVFELGSFDHEIVVYVPVDIAPVDN